MEGKKPPTIIIKRLTPNYSDISSLWLNSERCSSAERLSLPGSHSNTPTIFRRAAHGVRLYSPFKIQFSMRKQAQDARRYPNDDPRLEMVYVSSPVGSLRHRRSSGAGGAALPSRRTVLAHRYAHPFPARIKRKRQLGTHPHGILYVSWSDCDSTLSTARTSKTLPVKLTAVIFFF